MDINNDANRLNRICNETGWAELLNLSGAVGCSSSSNILLIYVDRMVGIPFDRVELRDRTDTGVHDLVKARIIRYLKDMQKDIQRSIDIMEGS